EQNHDVGVLVASSHAEIETTVVRSTQSVNGRFGLGIAIQNHFNISAGADASIRACLVEQNQGAGIAVVHSDATIEGTIVPDKEAEGDGGFGDGISVENGTVVIQWGDVTGNTRAGIANWGSDVKVISTAITCNTLDIDGETFNDIHASFEGSSDWRCSRYDAK